MPEQGRLDAEANFPARAPAEVNMTSVNHWCVRERIRGDESLYFIFATAVPGKPVAFVHLTWTVEKDPLFPYTVVYPSWEAFRAAWGESDT